MSHNLNHLVNRKKEPRSELHSYYRTLKLEKDLQNYKNPCLLPTLSPILYKKISDRSLTNFGRRNQSVDMAATKKYPQVYQYREKESVGGAPTFENIGLNPSVVTETDGEEASRSSIKMGEHNVPGTVSRGSPRSEKTFYHFLG